jgi:hypothetical protein
MLTGVKLGLMQLRDTASPNEAGQNADRENLRPISSSSLGG